MPTKDIQVGDFSREITKAVDEALQRAADFEFDLAKKRLDERRQEIVASALIQVRKTFEMQTLRDVVTFTVRLED